MRAKAKIRDARIPYEVPSREELPERLDTVLQVIYLVFNEGYSASSGETLTRPDLSGEAIRLGRLLVELLPEPEVMGLLALMLLHESCRAARTSPEGDLILLEDQDRTLWNQEQITEGTALMERALSSRQWGAGHDRHVEMQGHAPAAGRREIHCSANYQVLGAARDHAWVGPGNSCDHHLLDGRKAGVVGLKADTLADALCRS